MHVRAASSSWFQCIVCPLNWGWYSEVMLVVASDAWQKAFYTRETNWGRWSETMSRVMPWSWNTCWTMSWMVSKAVGSLMRGTKWVVLDKWSSLVRMTALPSNGVCPVTIAKATWDHGRPGMGSEWIPAESLFYLFILCTCRTSRHKLFDILIHRQPPKYYLIKESIQLTQGWQVNKDEQTQ